MRRERGITTIGLVVTIIVMLILAGVTISLMQGNSGIISKADESKSQTERKEVIEKAKMTVSEKVVNNRGNELTRSELKEILEQYFINVPEDYTLETILKTKEENGKYEIKVSEIYDRDIMTENEETDGSTEVVPPTSSTNVENGSSGNTGSGGNTGGTGNTNSESTSGGNSNNTGNGGSNSTEIDVTKVEMDKQTATVDINGENTVQLNAKVIPSNANKNTEITWTSKKKEVASVNQKGLVTGKTVGNSMIMATSQNGYSADCLVVCQAKITGITVNPVIANMTVGQKITLTATTSPEIVTEKVTWKSRNEDVAKVDNNGNVTGIGKGVVEIIAQNPGGTIQASCTVTVKINPTEIRLNYSKLVLDKNSSNIPKLEATILPDTTYVNDSIAWDSSNKNVVTVENGNLTLIGNGEAKITVNTENGLTATCDVTVQTSIISIAVSSTSKKMEVNQTAQLTATVTPADATEKVQWTSSNTDVAKVDNNGNVTGIGKGVVEIIAQNPGGTIQAVCTVTVKINPTGIRLNYSKLVLDKNSSNIPKLEATILPDTTYVNNSIVWDSSNKNVVIVENGKLTLIGNGKTQITAKTENGLTATCDVTVQTSITSIAVSSTSKKMEVNQTAQLTATVTPADATEKVQWTSSNTDVATVNDTGLITAKATGTATITVKNSDGKKSATCVVDVTRQVSTSESYVGYYSDVDGDGIVDGIIFADLLHGKTGQWENSNGKYTIPTIESTKVKSYKISQEDYTNQLGGTAKILTPAGEGENRFYVLALSDAGSCQLYAWLYQNAFIGNGWYVPSKSQWSMFLDQLGITKSNYKNYGLSDNYWTSNGSVNSDLHYWVSIAGGYFSDTGKYKYEVVDDYNYVRLYKKF